MSLKELLGEDLYNQVIEKAGDNKIAIVSDGNWFPKDKFDAKNQEVKDLQQQLNDRDEQLNALKDVDPEKLKQEIADLQEANDKTKNDYEAKLQAQAFEFTLEKALSTAGAKNAKAVKALLDTENIKLDGETLLGLDDQLKALQESDPYLFGEDEPPGLKGRKPNEGGTNTQGIKNPFSKEHFNLTEQAKLLKENPDLAKQLQNEG